MKDEPMDAAWIKWAQIEIAMLNFKVAFLEKENAGLKKNSRRHVTEVKNDG